MYQRICTVMKLFQLLYKSNKFNLSQEVESPYSSQSQRSVDGGESSDDSSDDSGEQWRPQRRRHRQGAPSGPSRPIHGMFI